MRDSEDMHAWRWERAKCVAARLSWSSIESPSRAWYDMSFVSSFCLCAQWNRMRTARGVLPPCVQRMTWEQTGELPRVPGRLQERPAGRRDFLGAPGNSRGRRKSGPGGRRAFCASFSASG